MKLLKNHMQSAIILSKQEVIFVVFLMILLYFLLSCGPIFGAGADLLISNGCNMNTESYSNLPHSYDGPNANCTSLLGDYNFTVIDYEVYTLATSSSTITKMKQERYS